MKYTRYHGLGNDYIVLRTQDLDAPLTPHRVVAICHRNFGVGSDGIVLIDEANASGISVRILNPDGSEAETSGNGMRIAARALHDLGVVAGDRFVMRAKGDREIQAQIFNPQTLIQVSLGEAKFLSSAIPATGSEREIIAELLEVDGVSLSINCVNVGNPHCVVLHSKDCKDDVLRFGPYLEHHPMFPERINVQFAQVLNRKELGVEIWERGAGYTLASGSSASAVACVARKQGLVDSEVTVHMPGGDLAISIDDNWNLELAGPVTKISSGDIAAEMYDGGLPR